MAPSYMRMHAHLPTIPSTTEYPGKWSFQISFGPLTESASKSTMWTYSDVCKKLYVNLASFCPIKFKTTTLPPPGTYLRAVAVFKGSTNLHDIVKRCPNHLESSNDGSASNNHFIRSNNPAARYHRCPESSRHSVLLPYKGPQVGTEYVTEKFAFMCFLSCASGPSRRPVEVIFTLEKDRQTLGRRVVEIRVCACPRRARKLDEKFACGDRSSSQGVRRSRKDEGCSVILRCHSCSIEVLYHSVGENTADFSCMRAVRRQLGLILECMRSQLCWLNNMRYQMSIICPVCCEGSAVIHCDTHDEQGCKQEECLHFWSESELCGSKRSIICDKSTIAEDITVDAKVWEPWFAPPAEQALEDDSGHKQPLAPAKERVGSKRKALNRGTPSVAPAKVARIDSECQEPDHVSQSMITPKNVALRGTILKEDGVTKDDLERLSRSVGNDWVSLGRRLNIDQATLDAIQIQ